MRIQRNEQPKRVGSASSYAAVAAVKKTPVSGLEPTKPGIATNKVGPKNTAPDKMGRGQGRLPKKAPPLPPLWLPSSHDAWWEMVERKRGTRKKKSKASSGKGANAAPTSASASNSKGGAGGTARQPVKRKKVRIRPPRSAAVIITLTADSLTCAGIMAEARQKVRLEDMGISHVRPKIAATGAIILKVPCEDSASKADQLAQKLRLALADKEVRISRPIKSAELRIVGVDESITRDDLAAAVAGAGDCPQDEIRVGEIRRGASGLGAAWVKCPAVAARRLVDMGRVMVGWVAARVEALAPRPLQCYRCLESGHTRARCTVPVERSDRCYRCGRPGHVAGGCSAAPVCPLCSDLGRSAGHRLGSAACNPPKRRRGAVGTPSTVPAPIASTPSGAGDVAAGSTEGSGAFAPLPPSVPSQRDPMSVPDPKPQRVRKQRGKAEGVEPNASREALVGAVTVDTACQPTDDPDPPEEAMIVD